MPEFRYAAPTSVEEVLAVVDGSDSGVLLAGGQSLLILLRQGLLDPDLVVSLQRVAGLDGIEVLEGGLRLGAMATYRSVAGSREVAQRAPLLRRAAGAVGSVHIRNRGTVGGSVCHADPAGDVPTALIALGASLETVAGSGATVRAYAAEDFYTGLFETRLRDGEMLRSVRLSAPAAGATIGYRRFSLRAGEYPVAVAACQLNWDGDICVGARVAVGGGGLTPLRLRQVEQQLEGSRVGREVAVATGQETAAQLEPLADVRGSTDWRRRILAALIRDSLLEAAPGGTHA